MGVKEMVRMLRKIGYSDREISLYLWAWCGERWEEERIGRID